MRSLKDAALRGATIIRRFGENTTTVERIVYDLADSGSVRVDIHAVTGAQVTHNALCSDVKGRAVQF